MDRLIYTAMTGASQVLGQQEAVSNNLANVSTNGFRAEIDSFNAVPVQGNAKFATRTQVSNQVVGTNFTEGGINQTGRALDVAIQGPGFIAVRAADGSEAYTRNGSLRTNAQGIIETSTGNQVIGDGGPITVPPDSQVLIGMDGTISSFVPSVIPVVSNVLGRIKLVNPPNETLVRGADGLFKTSNGAPAQADSNLKIAGGALESSNVSAVEGMVQMISLGRQFETQMALLKSAQENDTKASSILNLS